ncbi:MAG: helix-hairpin-helix domain-containing protein [Caldimonas sp.]
MFKKFMAALAALLAATAFAAVDANKATQAELEAVSGIGPVISTLIVNERKKGNFKDWNDFVTRVKGVGDRSAVKFSEGGLTVNGKAFAGAPEAPKAMAATTTQTASPPVGTARATASKAASAVVQAPAKVASAVKGGAKVVAENARDEKNALKENVADAKAKRAEKKAEKAEMKAEKAAAASAPKK